MISYSFIIPHKNTPELLYRCVESIPLRDDIEVIVIDDNSDGDKKPQISRKNLKLLFLSEEESKGAGHARNVGVSFASGKWLLFADSDDYYHDGFISYLDKYKDCDVDEVFFNATRRMINPNGISSENSFMKEILKFKSSLKMKKDIRELAMSTNVPWNKMFNANKLKEIGVSFEEIPFGNDAWFVLFFGSKVNSLFTIEEELYVYEMNMTGISRSKRPMSDYYSVARSTAKLNKLKLDVDLLDKVQIFGVCRNSILFNYGRWGYFKFFIYRFFIDSVLRIALVNYVKRLFCKFIR